MRVVYRNHERLSRREVGSEPVETMDYCERRVGCGALDGLTRQHRFGGRGRAREKRPALVRRGKGNSPLKELANHAEREATLQLRAARTHQLLPNCGRELGVGR